MQEEKEQQEKQEQYWGVCPECWGQGKKRRKLRKKVRLQYQSVLKQFEQSGKRGEAPLKPRGHLYSCPNCNGSGLILTALRPIVNTENYPHVAIIGAGIGGVALAVACYHRGIPFTLYERDDSFSARAQGYGLTLQQASKAIQGFGLVSLTEGVVSTRHLVHTTTGKVIGEWGMRKWMQSGAQKRPRRTNVHIARQSLRLALLEQLGGHDAVEWGHQLIGIKNSANNVALEFRVAGKVKKTTADLVVGADGIRSTVRRLLIDEKITPLRYLGCIVILGICPLKNLKGIESALLDSATVFQTANGHERMYMMPYTSDAIMWQLSFPMPENQAKTLSAKGSLALKKEACQRTPWHSPIPEILTATNETLISGYPVYDRDILQPEQLAKGGAVTVLGDAAHPMSPFKGQGANQALLDALALARGISRGCRPSSNWKEIGIRKSVLTTFEAEMVARSTVKVKDSAAAATFLHSDVALHEANEPRGRCLKKK